MFHFAAICGDLADRHCLASTMGHESSWGMHQQQEQQEAPSQRVVVVFLRTHAALKCHILFRQWQPCMVRRFVHID